MIKKSAMYAVAAVLLIAVAILGGKISRLEGQLTALENTVRNNELSLQARVNEIYGNVDDMLNKQASLFSKVSTKHGDFDPASGTVSLEISVVPKVLEKDMEITASMDGLTTEFIKGEDGEYTASVKLGIFKAYDTLPLLTIEADGKEKTEYLEDADVSNLWTRYLPTMETANINGSASYAAGGLTVDGKLELSYKAAQKNPKAGFSKFSLVTELDGKEIGVRDVTGELTFSPDTVGGFAAVPFRESYDADAMGYFAVYLIAEDSFGYMHKKQVFDWYHPDERDIAREPDVLAGRRDEIIMDKEGRVLSENRGS